LNGAFNDAQGVSEGASQGDRRDGGRLLLERKRSPPCVGGESRKKKWEIPTERQIPTARSSGRVFAEREGIFEFVHWKGRDPIGTRRPPMNEKIRFLIEETLEILPGRPQKGRKEKPPSSKGVEEKRDLGNVKKKH